MIRNQRMQNLQYMGLLKTHRLHKYIRIDLLHTSGKADLNQSNTMQLLLRAKGG